MRAWAEQAAGRDHAARAIVEPVLDGTVTSGPAAHRRRGAPGGGECQGDRGRRPDRSARAARCADLRRVPGRRAAVRDGRGQARELLAGHVGRVAETETFAARALAAGRRPDTRTARLDDGELRLLARLPSPLSVDQIARELRIPSTEASSRIRAVYLKLGVSSRRTAVSVAYERGLLR